MSEVYLYTYCAENALRAFIEAVEKKINPIQLKVSSDLLKKIKERKSLQEKKKWLTPRGTSDIFYLDIDDFAWILGNNWEIFKGYFESQNWVIVNIKEIADCRNQVAHHCYLEEHKRDIIRDNFIKLLKQISRTYN